MKKIILFVLTIASSLYAQGIEGLWINPQKNLIIRLSTNSDFLNLKVIHRESPLDKALFLTNTRHNSWENTLLLKNGNKVHLKITREGRDKLYFIMSYSLFMGKKIPFVKSESDGKIDGDWISQNRLWKLFLENDGKVLKVRGKRISTNGNDSAVLEYEPHKKAWKGKWHLNQNNIDVSISLRDTNTIAIRARYGILGRTLLWKRYEGE